MFRSGNLLKLGNNSVAHMIRPITHVRRPIIFHRPYVTYHSKVELPKLPIVEYIAGCFPSLLLKETNIFFLIHARLSQASVLEVMIRKLGAHPANMLAVGKFNSENKECIDLIRHQLGIYYVDNFLHPDYLDKEKEIIDSAIRIFGKYKNNNDLIVMDHGGILKKLFKKYDGILKQAGILSNTRKIMFCESTQSGHEQAPNEPTVSYAVSLVKRMLEGPFIGEQLGDSLTTLIPNFHYHPRKIGIIGFGAVGSSFAEALLSCQKKHEIRVFDPALKSSNPTLKLPIIVCESPMKVIEGSGDVFNCAPHDLMATKVSGQSIGKALIETCCRPINFFNCASDDKAYGSLTNPIIKEEKIAPLKDIHVKTRMGATLTFWKGGRPINFGNQPELSRPEDIQIIRMVFLLALIQSKFILHDPEIMKTLLMCNMTGERKLTNNIMLDPYATRLAALAWERLHREPYRLIEPDTLALLKDPEWVKDHEIGHYLPVPKLEAHLKAGIEGLNKTKKIVPDDDGPLTKKIRY